MAHPMREKLARMKAAQGVSEPPPKEAEPVKAEPPKETPKPQEPKKQKKPRERKPKGPAANDEVMLKRGRLPHRSCFHLDWDMDKQLWFGSLVVPMGGKSVSYTASDNKVFALLHKLDLLYRDDIAKVVREGNNDPIVTPA